MTRGAGGAAGSRAETGLQAETGGRAESGDALRVMTFNLRRQTFSWRRADRWRGRRPRVREILRRERLALLGVQEAMPAQLAWVRAALRDSTGGDYRVLGTGRHADGGDEASALLYDADRLEALGHRQIALSETPEVAGSRSWGAAHPRVAVIADFCDRRSGSPFRAANTHLDHVSARARERSAELLRRALLSSGLSGGGLPGGVVSGGALPGGEALDGGGTAILIGDFNMPPDAAAAAPLFAGGRLRDAWQAARERATPEYRTFGGYRDPRPGPRIDWVAVTPDIAVDRIEILASPVLGGWASDHLPVVAELRLPARPLLLPPPGAR